MTSGLEVTDERTPSGPPARWLLGRLSEHRELQGQLAERPGLLVIDADPLSGTSGVLAHCLAELSYPSVYVDARGTADAMDLAMRIADAAISSLRPLAAAWWLDEAVPFDAEGLKLTRTLSEHQVDLDELRDGSGRGLERLREALRLAGALSDGEGVVLAVDHLDALLETVSRAAAEELLAVLRSERQTSASAELLLVGRPDGRLVNALNDSGAALYRAGQSVRIRRAAPGRFLDDLAIARPWIELPAHVVGTAAELAEGAPAVLWRILDLARRDGSDVSAHSAWAHLEDLSRPIAAQQFELLGGAHRVAPTVVSALSHGIGPYELPANPKTVRDALATLRARGIVWSPEKGRWRIADPLLKSWARTHSPAWVRRRARRRA